jgi:uncharacterized protein YbjT (DUF2867 family)
MTAGATLVIGGTGKTGRRVVERLKARNLPVRVGSRSGTPPFVWESPETWAEALRGVTSVYVTYYPDLAARGAPEAIRAFLPVAKAARVQKLVLLSGRGEPECQACEQMVRECGIDYTIVRASWFAQNFSENYFLDGIKAGELALPAGNVGEPFIDVDDIADVVVAALTDPRHSGQLYEMTGPRLLTFAEAVAEIARETKRDIRFVQVPIADYTAGLESAHVPAEVVELVQYLFAEVLDGRSSWIGDGVLRALGRAPRDFSQYVRETAKTGIWNEA